MWRGGDTTRTTKEIKNGEWAAVGGGPTKRSADGGLQQPAGWEVYF